MSISAINWKNKKGSSERSCNCGSWVQHWINYFCKPWASKCSIDGCNNPATLGVHIINSSVSGEKNVPMCDPCNKLDGDFDLKGRVTVISENISRTCEK